ncbi:MAG TPA: hypothetical protein VFO30_08165, partial [Chthoniobacterales bacterium]|nr:hypothetical protein [Chthoniobacterales bacterium]
MRTAIRTATVAIALLSWLAISNHCAFAGVALKSQGAKSECPFHSKPARPQNPLSGIQCCKILRAITTAPVKAVARVMLDVADVDLPVDATAVSRAAHVTFVPETVGTGPPGTTSFVELIGSVQAHAPP